MKTKDNRLSVKEAAEFIGVHTNTIYEWIKEGILKADKEGKSYKVDHMSVFDVYSSRNIVDEKKQVILGMQNIRESLLNDLRFSSLETFYKIVDSVDYIKKFDIEHEKEWDSNRTLEYMYKKDYEKNKIILELKKHIDKHVELNNLIVSLENIQKQKQQKEMSFNDTLKQIKNMR